MTPKTYEEYLARCAENRVTEKFTREEWESLKQEFLNDRKILKKIEELDELKYKILRIRG